MLTHAIYTNLSDSVTLVCEQCHRSKALQATIAKDLPQPLKVRCPCGATFGVNIIIRQFYRKKTRLPGHYVRREAQTNKILEQGQMFVEDISRTGLGLRTLYKHTVLSNDVLVVTFTLDDQQKTDIWKSVRVRRVDDYWIGAAFIDHDTYTETNRILGFYLMPR
jgi:PilZ domain-containing protein